MIPKNTKKNVLMPKMVSTIILNNMFVSFKTLKKYKNLIHTINAENE